MSPIDALNDWALAWTGAIIRASWQGGLALLMVWGVSRFVKSVPARPKIWLWRIAYFKLLFAFFCSFAIDVPILPRAVKNAALSPIAGESTLESVQLNVSAGASMPGVGAVPPRGIQLSTLLLLLWLLGVTFCCVRLALQWSDAARIRRDSLPPEDPSCQSLCEELASRFSVRRAPSVLQSHRVSRPVLTGTARPAIILPADSAGAHTEKELRLVLAHELAHLRRRDLLWLWLPVAAESLFFFHPLVWLARRESSLMNEVACDELALRMASLPPSDYAAMLLSFVAGAPQPRADSIALGMFEGGKTIERRLVAMKHFTSHTARLSAAAIAAALILAVIVVLPWRVVAQNEPVSKDEIARLKEENAKLRDDLGRMRAELDAISQNRDDARQASAELEKTKRHLGELLKKYTQEHPEVRETREKLAALESEVKRSPMEREQALRREHEMRAREIREKMAAMEREARRALEARERALQHEIQAAQWEQQRKHEELRAQELEREKVKREELKQLIREEIGLVEKLLQEARKRVEAGTQPMESLIPLQREILKLKRELWAIE